MAGMSITQRESHELYNDTRLAAHIEVFRRQGHPIHTESITQNGSTFARYHYIQRKASHDNSEI